MKLKYLSHSAFEITTEHGYKILIDPFLDENPTSPVKSNEVHPDVILITHGHEDHIGDAEKIAKSNNSLIVAVYEIAEHFNNLGMRTHGMHIGGSHRFDFGEIKLTIAHHGSSYNGKYMGNPAGILLKVDNTVVYHCGDTGLFMDMQLIGSRNKIDYMLVPIGGNFTMDIEDAVEAVELVKPKYVIPMHYNTFEVINANPYRFIERLNRDTVTGLVLKPGEEIKLNTG